ncbi:uncharacterized protein SCHCODRAFT_02615494 [Schizophyllum commune H4-8]|nr:uncharacterized protein SCHCODRAFT_02615494 [Schizophyllum commune H4-8]KAI5896665.1 hypothetical protein SCHCODRAFT_02615494 [Schizophyllum commune H4-8]
MHILRELSTSTILCTKCANTIDVTIGAPELILRARSGYTPFTRNETSALRAGLARVYGDLRQCELEIARLEVTLHTLRESQKALELTADCINALLSPIRRLPPELLAEIAPYTLPSRWFTDHIGKHPWYFSQVCRSWRSVAIATGWAWAQIRFPQWLRVRIVNRADLLSHIVGLYLQRAAATGSPIKIRGLRKAHVEDERTRACLMAYADCIHTLEVKTKYDLLPFTCHLTALQRLIVHNELFDNVDAPNVRIVDLYEASPSTIELPWANLRAFKMHGCISGPDLTVLRSCTALEVLSLTDDTLGLEFHSDPLVFPALHTLEIGSAAIEVCPHLVAPALHHFILNMGSDDNYTWHVELQRSPLQMLANLLPPVTSLTLRNMDTYDFENIPVRELLALPRKLQKVSAVIETDYALQSGTLTMYRDLVTVLGWDEAHPTLPHLTEIDLVSGTRDIPWSDDDVALVRRLLVSRAAGAATGGCARLERLNIRTPFAPFPVGPLAESWADARGTDGQRVMAIDRHCQGEPVEAFDIETALR